jgi:hypothetical protein
MRMDIILFDSDQTLVALIPKGVLFHLWPNTATSFSAVTPDFAIPSDVAIVPQLYVQLVGLALCIHIQCPGHQRCHRKALHLMTKSVREQKALHLMTKSVREQK